MSIATLINHNRNHLGKIANVSGLTTAGAGAIGTAALAIPFVGPVIAAVAGIIGATSAVVGGVAGAAEQQATPIAAADQTQSSTPTVRVLRGGGYERSGPPPVRVLPHTKTNTAAYVALGIVATALVIRMRK